MHTKHLITNWVLGLIRKYYEEREEKQSVAYACICGMLVCVRKKGRNRENQQCTVNLITV